MAVKLTPYKGLVKKDPEWKENSGDDRSCPTCGRYDWAGHKENCPWYRKSQYEGCGPLSHR